MRSRGAAAGRLTRRLQGVLWSIGLCDGTVGESEGPGRDGLGVLRAMAQAGATAGLGVAGLERRARQLLASRDAVGLGHGWGGPRQVARVCGSMPEDNSWLGVPLAVRVGHVTGVMVVWVSVGTGRGVGGWLWAASSGWPASWPPAQSSQRTTRRGLRIPARPRIPPSATSDAEIAIPTWKA